MLLWRRFVFPSNYITYSFKLYFRFCRLLQYSFFFTYTEVVLHMSMFCFLYNLVSLKLGTALKLSKLRYDFQGKQLLSALMKITVFVKINFVMLD